MLFGMLVLFRVIPWTNLKNQPAIKIDCYKCFCFVDRSRWVYRKTNVQRKKKWYGWDKTKTNCWKLKNFSNQQQIWQATTLNDNLLDNRNNVLVEMASSHRWCVANQLQCRLFHRSDRAIVAMTYSERCDCSCVHSK